MWRKLFNLFTLLSLLLGALTLAVLFRSRTLYDTVILRTAPSYGARPQVKFVTINAYYGWVIQFKQKREPSFHGIAPPWREDVPFSSKQVVRPDEDRFARAMTDAERAAYEVQAGHAYRSTPLIRWEVLRVAPATRYSSSVDATSPLWKRLGFNWFVWQPYAIDEENYPGTYRSARLTVPHKAVLIVAAVLPSAWAALWLRRYVAGRRAGRCPGCGYDLRGSPNRCPECGREVTEAEARRAGFATAEAPSARSSKRRSRRLLPALRRRWDVVTFGAVVLALAFGLYRGAVATRDAPSQDLVNLRRELDAQFDDLAREVVWLRESGDGQGAEALDAELRRLRDQEAGKTLVTSDVPELNVIGVFEGSVPEGPVRMAGNEPIGRVVVEVRPTGRPTVLALCGKETVEWQLRGGAGARLRRVVLGGESDQEIVGVPEGVPLDEHTQDGRSPDQFDTYRRYQDISYRNMEAALWKLTGLRVGTFQGDFRLPDRSVVVGPGSPEWEAQRVLAAMEPLREATMGRALRRVLPDLASVRFDALWRDPHERDGIRGHRGAVFDLAGPLAGTLRELPREWVQFTVDPATRTYYGTDGNHLYRLEPRWERAVEVENADGTERDLGYCTSLAFDTRRRRVLLCGRGATSYAPDTGTWTTLGPLNTYRPPDALAYSAAEDCFYGVTRQYIKAPAAIVRLSPDGEAQWRIPLVERVEIGSGITSGSTTQLVAVGPLLALIPPMDAGTDAAKQAPPRVVLIDPGSNRVVYRSNLTVHSASPVSTRETRGH